MSTTARGCALAAVMLATAACAEQVAHPALGVRVPDFVLPAMQGGTVRLANVTDPWWS